LDQKMSNLLLEGSTASRVRWRGARPCGGSWAAAARGEGGGGVWGDRRRCKGREMEREPVEVSVGVSAERVERVSATDERGKFGNSGKLHA
jgi:hypothetical protein